MLEALCRGVRGGCGAGERGYTRAWAACQTALLARLPHNTSLVLTLEDDIRLRPGFISLLAGALHHRQARLATIPWLDIKLYFQPRLRGYGWDLQPLTELLATAGLLAGLAELLLLYVWPRPAPARPLLLYCLMVLLLLAVSRQHLQQCGPSTRSCSTGDPRPPAPPWPCCTTGPGCSPASPGSPQSL